MGKDKIRDRARRQVQQSRHMPCRSQAISAERCHRSVGRSIFRTQQRREQEQEPDTTTTTTTTTTKTGRGSFVGGEFCTPGGTLHWGVRLEPVMTTEQHCAGHGPKTRHTRWAAERWEQDKRELSH